MDPPGSTRTTSHSKFSKIPVYILLDAYPSRPNEVRGIFPTKDAANAAAQQDGEEAMLLAGGNIDKEGHWNAEFVIPGSQPTRKAKVMPAVLRCPMTLAPQGRHEVDLRTCQDLVAKMRPGLPAKVSNRITQDILDALPLPPRSTIRLGPVAGEKLEGLYLVVVTEFSQGKPDYLVVRAAYYGEREAEEAARIEMDRKMSELQERLETLRKMSRDQVPFYSAEDLSPKNKKLDKHFVGLVSLRQGCEYFVLERYSVHYWEVTVVSERESGEAGDGASGDDNDPKDSEGRDSRHSEGDFPNFKEDNGRSATFFINQPTDDEVDPDNDKSHVSATYDDDDGSTISEDGSDDDDAASSAATLRSVLQDLTSLGG